MACLRLPGTVPHDPSPDTTRFKHASKRGFAAPALSSYIQFEIQPLTYYLQRARTRWVEVRGDLEVAPKSVPWKLLGLT